MDELLKTLMILSNYCKEVENCKECSLKQFCGQIIQDWY